MEAEIVGQCKRCEKTVYCRDGFLDGVVNDIKELYCHSCYELEQSHEISANSKPSDSYN